MIRVNLLPHREEKRKRRQTQFLTLLGLTVALAAIVVVGSPGTELEFAL